MRLLVVLLCLTHPVSADDRGPLYGTWGTAKQCDRQLVITGGTKRAEPFEIRPGWLRHGQVWCRLTWFPTQTRNDGIFVGTQSLCGEDSANAYRIDFSLTGDALTLIWDNALINDPLYRCDTR